MFYNDSQGTQKTGAIDLEYNHFTGLNLIPKTFKANIEIGTFHTEFTLKIFDHNLEEIAFKFTVYDFDHFLALINSLGIVISQEKIMDFYRKKIKEANNYPYKLDVIYESLPKTLFGKMDDVELYEHLNIILHSIFPYEKATPTNFDTNEDKAVLQILYAIRNRRGLYTMLRDTNLLYKIYSKLHGEEIQDLLRFLTRLVAEFDDTTPTDTVYFDNSYYLFRDTHLKTEWLGRDISIDNYIDKTIVIGRPRMAVNPKELDKMYPPGVEKVYTTQEYFIKNKSFNPLAKLNFGTKLGELGEQKGDENTFVIALKLHNMATKQYNWDLFNVVTDFLSLLSSYGALRIVIAETAPAAARALAGLVLAKDATHYTLLSNKTLEKWHENGYGWLANLWIAFSVTVDLASFGLPNLSKIPQKREKPPELAKSRKGEEIKRVADEANKIVKAETGKDVSKMTEKEFEKFIRKTKKKEENNPEQYGEFIDTPENLPGKKAPKENINAKRESRKKEISKETEKGNWRDKDHNKKKIFSNDQLETFIEIELIHDTKVRPSEAGEAGDVVGLTGRWAGKTFDAAGLPNDLGAIKGWEYKFIRNLKRFKESIDEHFGKLTKSPPLDKFVLDLRYIDKYPSQTKKEILDYLEDNYSLYMNNKDKFEIIF
ncbi:hypothetical protein ACFFWB_16650 [Flavobacterium procerum]|uniref:hypothetical protein n=1 Tax=Flavobacterium procerum TaxID=1455569 RepID=UPI0035E7AB39